MGHTKVKTTLDMYSHIVEDAVYEKTVQTLDVYLLHLHVTRNREAKLCSNSCSNSVATPIILGGFRGKNALIFTKLDF